MVFLGVDLWPVGVLQQNPNSGLTPAMKRSIPTLEAFGLLLRRERLAPLALAVDELLEVLRLHRAGAGTARPRAALFPTTASYGDEPSPPLLPGLRTRSFTRRTEFPWPGPTTAVAARAKFVGHSRAGLCRDEDRLLFMPHRLADCLQQGQQQPLAFK
jgi:hypothetical protein